MKIILVLGLIAGAVVGMIGALFVGGLFIARNHTVTRSLRLGVPAERVWELINDPESQTAWRPNLKEIKRGPDRNGHPVWLETDKRGQVLAIETTESVPNSRLVGKIVDEGLPFGGSWTFELIPEAAGCRLRITEDGFIKPPPFRYIARLMGYDATIRQFLEAVAAKLGQPALIDP